MDEFLEAWPEQPRDLDPHVGSPVQPKRHWNDRSLFLMKAGLLLATTVALIPILAWQHTFAATLYIIFLVVVHIAGLAIFAFGLRREHFGWGRGLAIRIGGLVLLTGLLYLASKGLSDAFGSLVFWISLTAIWALHTAGAAMLHFRPRAQNGSFCPFV